MAQKIAAPKRRPRLGGLKDIIDPFVDEPRITATTDFVWEDSGCSVSASATRAGCVDDVVADGDFDEDATGIGQFELIGPAFARFKAIRCFLGGDNDSDGTYEAQAIAALEAVEDREIEAVLWGWAEAATATSTASSFVGAIAAAEEYADRNYIGMPLMIMSRGSAQAAFEKGALSRKDGVLVTGNGTPVLATGSVPDAEQDTVAVIGWPAVYVGKVVAAMATDHRYNTALAVAQRAYGIGVDCEFRYTATVTAP